MEGSEGNKRREEREGTKRYRGREGRGKINTPNFLGVVASCYEVKFRDAVVASSSRQSTVEYGTAYSLMIPLV